MADITTTGLLGSTDGVVMQLLTQTYPALADSVSASVYYLAIIYVGVFGYRVLNGHEPINSKIILEKAALMILVFGALNWGGVAGQIYGFFTSFAEGSAATIMAGQPTSTLFDALQDNVNQLITAILKKSAWDAFAIIIACMVALFINASLLIIALVNMILAKVGLAITMLLLPLYVGFLFFAFTRQWFMNWVSMMLNFCLIYIITIAVIRFGFLVFADAIAQIEQATGAIATTVVSIKQVVSVAVMQGILAVFLWQVRNLASSLSGGAVVQGSRAVEQFTGVKQ